MEPYIANTTFHYLLTQQGAKVLLPGQTDIKYLFLQGYGSTSKAPVSNCGCRPPGRS